MTAVPLPRAAVHASECRRLGCRQSGHQRTNVFRVRIVVHLLSEGFTRFTIATQLGMDPDKELPTPLGRPISLTQNGRPIRALAR